MKRELYFKDGNYFGVALKINDLWVIKTFDAWDETYTKCDTVKDIKKYLKDNKLDIIKFKGDNLW